MVVNLLPCFKNINTFVLRIGSDSNFIAYIYLEAISINIKIYLLFLIFLLFVYFCPPKGEPNFGDCGLIFGNVTQKNVYDGPVHLNIFLVEIC